MPKFRITAPDGASYEITAPDGASEQDVMAFAQRAMADESTRGPAMQGGPGRFAAPRMKDAPSAKVGTMMAGLEGVLQGATLGFADEIEGGARALWKKDGEQDQRGLGEVYADTVQIPRERARTAAETNPGAYYTGEIASGLAVPGGLARVGIRGAMAGAAGRGIGARTLAGAKEGAAYGAVAGAGHSEGGSAATIEGAAKGAALGGAIGSATPVLVDAGSAVASRAALPFRAALNPRQVAGEKLGEAMSRDLAPGGVPANTTSIGQRFANRFDDMAASSSSARAMDVGGENTRGLMRAASNMPNQSRQSTKQAVDARQAGQWSRIETAMDKHLVPGRRAEQSIDDMIAAREAQAAPDFQTAFGIATPMTPGLQAVLSRPTMAKIGDRLKLRAEDEGVGMPVKWNTEWLHRAKLELDDLIGQAKRAEVMGNTPQAGFDLRTLTVLKHDLLKNIQNAPYKAALQRYSGATAMIRAAEDGAESFLKSSPYEIAKALRKLPEAEQEMYRLGAKDAIFQRLEAPNVNRDLTDSVFGNAGMQARLRVLFPSQKAFREFQRDLVVEAKMADSRKALQGNSTTAKQLAEGDQAGKGSRLVASAMHATSGRLEPVLNFLAQGYNRFSGLTPAVANEILQQGMARHPSHGGTALLSMSNQALARAQQAAQQRALTSSAIVGGLANPIGISTAPINRLRGDLQ